ncbi:C1 family peptidase [bacterium]|nr:C1 family peptidase [bacterium]
MMASIDLRERMSPVGDQGIRPTCVAFALTACHEFIYKLSPKELSKDSLQWKCVCREGSANNGVSVATAILVLNEEGQHLEEDWPYIPHLDELTWESLQPPKLDGKSVFKIARGISMRIADPNALLNILKTRGPLFVILPIWESFFLPQNGQIPMPETDTEEYRGLHAVSLVGLTNGGNVIIRNSWGTSWGNSGYGIMPFEYLRQYASNTYFLIPSGVK